MDPINTTLYEEGTNVPLNPSTTSEQVEHHDTTVEKALDRIDEEAVKVTEQNLTDKQMQQARENIKVYSKREIDIITSHLKAPLYLVSGDDDNARDTNLQYVEDYILDLLNAGLQRYELIGYAVSVVIDDDYSGVGTFYGEPDQDPSRVQIYGTYYQDDGFVYYFALYRGYLHDRSLFVFDTNVIRTDDIANKAVTKEKLADGIIPSNGNVITVEIPDQERWRNPDLSTYKELFGEDLDLSRILTHNLLFRVRRGIGLGSIGEDQGIGVPISNYIPESATQGHIYVFFRVITDINTPSLIGDSSIFDVQFRKIGTSNVIVTTSPAELGYRGILNLLADNSDGTSLVWSKSDLEVGKSYTVKDLFGLRGGTPPFISTGSQLYKLVSHITEGQAEALATAVNDKFNPSNPVTADYLENAYIISSGFNAKTMVGDKIDAFGIIQFGTIFYILS